MLEYPTTTQNSLAMNTEWQPFPRRMGSTTARSHLERRSGTVKGSLCLSMAVASTPAGVTLSPLRLTTAHSGSVPRATSTGSGDGQSGHG